MLLRLGGFLAGCNPIRRPTRPDLTRHAEPPPPKCHGQQFSAVYLFFKSRVCLCSVPRLLRLGGFLVRYNSVRTSTIPDRMMDSEFRHGSALQLFEYFQLRGCTLPPPVLASWRIPCWMQLDIDTDPARMDDGIGPPPPSLPRHYNFSACIFFKFYETFSSCTHQCNAIKLPPTHDSGERIIAKVSHKGTATKLSTNTRLWKLILAKAIHRSTATQLRPTHNQRSFCVFLVFDHIRFSNGLYIMQNLFEHQPHIFRSLGESWRNTCTLR